MIKMTNFSKFIIIIKEYIRSLYLVSYGSSIINYYYYYYYYY
jgi:hypothetical protein